MPSMQPNRNGERTMLKKSLGIGAILLMLGTPAIAQQRAIAALKKACGGDIKTLCQDVKPGGGRIKDCIKSHFGDLKEGCQAEVTKVATAAKACVEDFKKNCPGVKPRRGRIEACMKEHVADLSDACKDLLSETLAGKN